jgi:hypothetical protein
MIVPHAVLTDPTEVGPHDFYVVLTAAAVRAVFLWLCSPQPASSGSRNT